MKKISTLFFATSLFFLVACGNSNEAANQDNTPPEMIEEIEKLETINEEIEEVGEEIEEDTKALEESLKELENL